MYLKRVCSILCIGFIGSVWAGKTPPLKQTPHFQAIPSNQSHIERAARLIANLVHARELKAVRESGVLGAKRDEEITGIPSLTADGNGVDRRIGEQPVKAAKAHESGIPNDPIDALRHTPPRSTVVGPAGLPDKGSLTRQDGGGGTEYRDGSSSPHGSVWAERSTSRQSSDGSRTWGSTSYRDYSGNHWRADYTDTRREDGTVLSKDTVFDSHGEPIKTTVRESFYDGSAVETTTTHETGEVKQTVGTFDEIFPARNIDPDAPSRSNAVAPRGWYNPISGAKQNPGLRTNNNQVNPGRADPQPKAAAPLRLNPKDLVMNPAPDALTPVPSGPPRDIRAGNPTIVDPPRPPQ